MAYVLKDLELVAHVVASAFLDLIECYRKEELDAVGSLEDWLVHEAVDEFDRIAARVVEASDVDEEHVTVFDWLPHDWEESHRLIEGVTNGKTDVLAFLETDLPIYFLKAVVTQQQRVEHRALPTTREAQSNDDILVIDNIQSLHKFL